mgnify:FL=1
MRREIEWAKINAASIDRWVEEGWQWGVPIDCETYTRALSGEWSLLLTPTKPVPKSWFPPLEGVRVLGLASGGGQQMPIFAARGAVCTLLEYSERQIRSDVMVAEREGYPLEVVHADMSRPLPFGDESFDLIFHPVSNCYIEEVIPVWRECHRILRSGGLLMAGLDNGVNFTVSTDERTIIHPLPFNPVKDPALLEVLEQEDSGIQFSHTLEEQVRGQLKAGFALVDLYEDTNGSGFLHEMGIPTFWATLARK